MHVHQPLPSSPLVGSAGGVEWPGSGAARGALPPVSFRQCTQVPCNLPCAERGRPLGTTAQCIIFAMSKKDNARPEHHLVTYFPQQHIRFHDFLYFPGTSHPRAAQVPPPIAIQWMPSDIMHDSPCVLVDLIDCMQPEHPSCESAGQARRTVEGGRGEPLQARFFSIRPLSSAAVSVAIRCLHLPCKPSVHQPRRLF